MIRFADVATDAKPKTAAAPRVEVRPEPVATADKAKPAKTPRKPKKSA